MQKVYEDTIREICQLDDWRKAPKSEREGAVGIACLLGYFNGVKPEIISMAKHLGLNESEVEQPMKRLLGNGVFSERIDIKSDRVMLGKSDDIVTNNFRFTHNKRMMNAWCWYAGIASGFCGLRES